MADEPVLVVGAGMAGLGAARRLHDAGCEVVVLEARDRIGGRLHTVDLLGATVDLGGAWIHGPEGNPVTALAFEAGVTGTPTVWHRDPARLLVADPSGPLSDVTGFSRGVSAFWERLETAKAGHRRAGAPAMSVAEAVAEGVVPDGDLEGTRLLGFRHAASVSVQSLEADDADRISFDELVLDERPGGDLLLTGGGYRGVVRHLARDLDVALGWPVSKVSVRPDGVELSGPGGVRPGAAVILTVPLGVLVAGDVVVDPPLPAALTEALTSLGMGCAEKLALGFAERRWPQGVTSIALVDTPPDDPFPAWSVHPTEAILVSYAGGSRARRFARTPDADLVEHALRGLRRVIPDLPDPVAVARSAWTNDPWSRGAYSYNAACGAGAARRALAEPIHRRLVLAGEATEPHRYGTAHGALASGRRAAEQVLDALS